MKTIIGISGNIGAGKGVVTEYITSAYGAEHMRFSRPLQDILDRLHLPFNRKNAALLADALRGTFGGAVLSNTLLEDVRKSNKELIVFDGIRKKDELEKMRELQGFVFLFIDAPLEIRYDRIVERGEKTDDRAKSLEDFKRDHERPADKDVPNLKEEADYIIDNSGTRANLHEQVDRIIHLIRNGE